MSVPAPPPFAGLPGLYQSDPTELAAHLFGYVFAGASLASPRRDMHQVDMTVAWLAGLDLMVGPFDIMVNPTLWPQLQPYVLESVALWQAARVAAVRTSGGDHTSEHVFLLRRGEQLLRAADPVAALRGWLDVDSELR